MTLSVLASSYGFPHGNHNETLDSDIDDLLDVEEIFSSVFSPCFDDESNTVSQVTHSDFSLHFNEPHSMNPWPLPLPSPSSMHYATPVSPTASCAELVRVENLARVNNDDVTLCEPTPLQDMMSFIPQFPQEMKAKSNQGQKRAVSPVQKAKNPRPTKKRRGETLSATTTKQVSSMGDNQDEFLEQTRERNREHARKSRLRKKALTSNLQQSLEELKAENKRLRTFVVKAFGPKKTESLIQERQISSPVEDFIAALKQPNNRIVDNHALQFLASLREEATSATSAMEQPIADMMDEKLEDFASFYVIG